MTTTTEMTFCAHCGRPRPRSAEGLVKRPSFWSVHDVRHGDGTIRTVAVCPDCRFRGRAIEDHEPGTCGGRYAGPDAWTATCKETYCNARWSCWDEACVEGWRDEHYVDECECSNCYDGHHNTRVTKPGGKR